MSDRFWRTMMVLWAAGGAGIIAALVWDCIA